MSTAAIRSAIYLAVRLATAALGLAAMAAVALAAERGWESAAAIMALGVALERRQRERRLLRVCCSGASAWTR